MAVPEDRRSTLESAFLHNGRRDHPVPMGVGADTFPQKIQIVRAAQSPLTNSILTSSMKASSGGQMVTDQTRERLRVTTHDTRLPPARPRKGGERTRGIGVSQ